MSKTKVFATAACAALVLVLAGLTGCSGNTSTPSSSSSSNTANKTSTTSITANANDTTRASANANGAITSTTADTTTRGGGGTADGSIINIDGVDVVKIDFEMVGNTPNLTDKGGKSPASAILFSKNNILKQYCETREGFHPDT